MDKTSSTPAAGEADAVTRMAYEERLRFETMLSDLSARFIRFPVDEVDGAIENAQRQICECLDIDVSSLWQLSEEQPGSMFLTHYHLPPDFSPVPEVMDAREVSPWSLDKVLNHETVVIPSVSNSPPAAARDQALWEYFGMRAVLTFPLSVGGEATFGALHFGMVRVERTWSPDLVGRLRLVAQIFANTIARRRTDQELKESEARVTLAAAAADAGLWVLNAEGTSFWVNEKISPMFGLAPTDQLTPDQFFALIHPDDRVRVQEVVDQALNSTEMAGVEYRIVRPDGNLRWMHSRGRTHPSAQGEGSRLMGITADITDRKRIEQEASELRGGLSHITRVSTMGELAASLAHELNQPLAAILSNAQAAIRFLAEPEVDMNGIREILDDIVRDDKRAGDVIQRLQALVKNETGATEWVDLNELVREVERLLNSECIDRSVEAELKLSPAPVPVFTSSVEIQQVILNLMLNAMDAMEDLPAGERKVTVETTLAKDWVRLSVRDFGPGVPEELLEKIFHPFFTKKKNGLGMGLAISRSIIDSCGGRLWAENLSGGGALFLFDLPSVKGGGD